MHLFCTNGTNTFESSVYTELFLWILIEVKSFPFLADMFQGFISAVIAAVPDSDFALYISLST